MSKEIVTKKDADEARAKLAEVERMFQDIREKTKELDSVIARKLFQAVMIPLALLIDFTRLFIPK